MKTKKENELLKALKGCYEILVSLDNDQGEMPSDFIESVGELIRKTESEKRNKIKIKTYWSEKFGCRYTIPQD